MGTGFWSLAFGLWSLGLRTLQFRIQSFDGARPKDTLHLKSHTTLNTKK